jgi:hypothetical protein
MTDEKPSDMDSLLSGLQDALKEADKWTLYPVPLSGPLYSESRGVVPPGTFMRVRPAKAAEDGTHKTYFGIYVGDLPIDVSLAVKKETSESKLNALLNPAIFVPALRKLVFGCESWWSPLKPEDVDKLEPITDENIENVWYVKALSEWQAASSETPASKET